KVIFHNRNSPESGSSTSAVYHTKFVQPLKHKTAANSGRSAAGAIPQTPDLMPDEMLYDPALKRLHVGGGYVENVPPEVWAYEVSGKQVLTQWFSYRRRTREKPPMGDKRPPSELCKIQPDGRLAEYMTELFNMIHVLGRLVEVE